MKEDSLNDTVISKDQSIISFYSSGRLQIMVAWHNADDPETDAQWIKVRIELITSCYGIGMRCNYITLQANHIFTDLDQDELSKFVPCCLALMWIIHIL